MRLIHTASLTNVFLCDGSTVMEFSSSEWTQIAGKIRTDWNFDTIEISLTPLKLIRIHRCYAEQFEMILTLTDFPDPCGFSYISQTLTHCEWKKLTKESRLLMLKIAELRARKRLSARMVTAFVL